jgi:hypothetical protein
VAPVAMRRLLAPAAGHGQPFGPFTLFKRGGNSYYMQCRHPEHRIEGQHLQTTCTVQCANE